MADVLPWRNPSLTGLGPPALGMGKTTRTHSAPTLTLPPNTTAPRHGHLNLGVFSPVTQNGSFEFDRVLRSGEVQIRSRTTKQWKRYFLVLRPNLLSMYKNSSEEKLLKQINLIDLTAAAYIKDPKGKRNFTFGLFSHSRNYQLQARSQEEARKWVDLIRREARLDEDEDSIGFGSGPEGLPVTPLSPIFSDLGSADRLASSSPEPVEATNRSTTSLGIRIPNTRTVSFSDQDRSLPDPASFSDMSDSGISRVFGSYNGVGAVGLVGAALAQKHVADTRTRPSTTSLPLEINPAINPNPRRSVSRQTDGAGADVDLERVLWQGHLHCLKSKGGVRQWKRFWVVLRPKNLGFYKNEDEYSAHLIIDVSSIISVDEIDPVSRHRLHCLQIVVEDKNYRLCAQSEDALARFVGVLKSQLARRRDKGKDARR